MKKGNNNSITRWISFGFLFLAVTMMIGCAPESPKPKEFDSSIKGPQMIVEPDVIRLGIATFLGAKIVFRGREFDSEEKIMIVLSGDDEGNKEVSIPFCFGKTDKNGNFTQKTTHQWSHGMDARRYAIVGSLPEPQEKRVVYDAMKLVDIDF